MNQGTETLRVEATDRVRIAVATIATIVALPVLVSGLTHGKHPSAPVAAVPGGGADLASSLRAAASSAGSAPATTPPVPDQPADLPRATSPTQPAVLDIAIPASTSPDSAQGLADYRNLGTRHGLPACITPLVPVGTTVAVVDTDNGHKLSCLVIDTAALPQDEVIVIDTTSFSLLGDPVESPIPVALTW